MKTLKFIHACFCSPLAFMRHPRQWGIGVVCFLLSFGLIAWGKDYISLVYNPTASLPWRYFIRLKQSAPQRGHYACVPCPWYGGTLIKKVAGTAGDIIHYDFEGNLWIRRHLKVGKPKKRAKDGRLLTPLAPGVIPHGQVFIMGEHDRSLDSRYAEVGLIPEHALQGRVIPLG